MTNWVIAAKRADFNKIAEKFQISPILARIIRNRDMIEDQEIEKFLTATTEDMYDPMTMKGMKEGIDILSKKIIEGKKIRIIGDYDIDGVCATVILKKGISLCGGDVDQIIPHRMKDGYGLNIHLISEAYEAGIDTIITCDNGISATKEIAYGKQLGMTIIVTDHHEVPYEDGVDGIRTFLPPEADIIIDPKQTDCKYPFSEICGGAVAYKVMEALFILMGQDEQWEEIKEELLELAAFATVGDVMQLRDENRIIVKYGLQTMEHTKNQGLQSLMEVTGIQGKKLSPYHIGFVLGPCLNATGRLDTAMKAFQLLDTHDSKEALKLANELKKLNDLRKDLTLVGTEEAKKQIETTDLINDNVLVVFLPDCHESLAGIIAGRIREQYVKPTFILTRGEEGVKGSGRSIEAYHMYEEMTKCKELFQKYGGHKLAAGLSLEENNITLFRTFLNENNSLTEEDFIKKIIIDVPLPPSYATKKMIQEIDQLAPFGVGNTKPIFAYKSFTFISGKVLGKNRNVGKYIALDQEGKRYDMIYFGELASFHALLKRKFGKEIAILYEPTINEFQGHRSIQFNIQDYQLH